MYTLQGTHKERSNEVSKMRWLAKRKFLTVALCIFICPIVSSCTEKTSILDEDTAEAPVLHENVEVSYEINEPDDNNTHQEMAELPAIIQPQPPITPPQPPVIQPQPEKVDNTPKPEPTIIQPQPPVTPPQPPVIQPQPEKVDNTPKPEPTIIQPQPPVTPPQPPVIQPQPERVDNTPIPCSRFKNCTELKRVHPDGVNTARLSCAKDRNKLDRDNDGWACE